MRRDNNVPHRQPLQNLILEIVDALAADRATKVGILFTRQKSSTEIAVALAHLDFLRLLHWRLNSRNYKNHGGGR